MKRVDLPRKGNGVLCCKIIKEKLELDRIGVCVCVFLGRVMREYGEQQLTLNDFGGAIWEVDYHSSFLKYIHILK